MKCCACARENKPDERSMTRYHDVGVTRGTTFADHPGKGRWAYRITMSANWADDATGGDALMVSAPVEVTG